VAQKEEKADESEIEKACESILYDIGKIRMIITPVYNEKSGKPLHGILINIMKEDAKNLYK
jgi:hypothetical protein